MIHSSLEQRDATSPAHSCWVEASAGTGKTKVLTDRVLNLLLMGAPAEHILCLTFTKAAAAEMANRIQEKLATWAALPEETLRAELGGLLSRPATGDEIKKAKKLFQTVIDTPGGMKIQTIHSFCQTILKKFPLEADIPPHFTVMDEAKSYGLLKEAFQKTLSILSHSLLDVLSKHASPTQLFDLLWSLCHKRPKVDALLTHTPSFDKLAEKVYGALSIPLHLSPLKLLEEAFTSHGDFLKILPLLAESSQKDQKMGLFLKKWVTLTPLERAHQFRAYQSIFLTTTGGKRKSFVAADISKRNPEILSFFSDEADRLQQLETLYHQSIVAEATDAFLTFILCCFQDYKTLKASGALLDYDDLIHLTANLFQKPDIAPWVLYKLDGGIQHILVDEAQDTNEYQWQVIGSIAEEFFREDPETPRTLFVVGDMKQSIYSFQGANPAAFQSMKDFFKNASTTAGHPWKDVNLSTSFRSTEPILSLVDSVFQKSPRLSPLGLDLPYLAHSVHRIDHGGHVEIWPLITSQEKEERSAWSIPNKQIKTSNPRKDLAQKIAQEIQGWMMGGKILTSKNRPIQPQDIMILVRRRDAFVEELVRALKNHGIPVTGVDRLVLTDNIGVMDLLVLSDFLLLPEDDLSLATVLKGPLVGMTEDDLFDLAYGRGHRSLWHVLKNKILEKDIYFHSFNFLTDLMNQVDFLSPFDLYSHILNTLGGHQKMVARLGTEVEDALEEFLNLALTFSNEHIGSLQEFVAWIRQENMEIKRNLEGDGDKVRIMTVHGAKGLQAPIVFLPDTTQVPLSRSTLFWDDDPENPLLFWCPKARFKTDKIKNLHPHFDEMAEYYRLLYVALTRAEDELYICGWQPKNGLDEKSWYQVILEGAKDVMEPFADGKGLYLHKERIVIPSTTVHTAPVENKIPHPSWLFEPVKNEPVFKRITPSGMTHDDEKKSPGISYSISQKDRGTLLHKALEWLVKDPGKDRMTMTRHFLSEHLTAMETAESIIVLQESMKRLSPYFQKGAILTEVPLQSVDTQNHQVIKGTMDFLWIHENTIHIVDYKTGSFSEIPPAGYVEQMRIYKDILKKIYPTHTVQTFLLWIDAQKIIETF